jgi:membrane-bound serine protease (ClpP class)
MPRRLLSLLAFVAPLLVPFVASAQSSSVTPSVAPDDGAQAAVLVVKVDGSIDRTVDGYLRDAIADAERDGAAVVIQLDSAGTLDGDPVALAERIHDARVPVIVWTGPAPAKSAGGGLLLMYAASEGAVAPGIGVGPTVPLDLAGGADVTTDDVRALAEDWASERGRETPTLFPDEPVPAQAAVDGHVANVVASSITQLLDELDGRTVGTAVGDVTLHTKVATRDGEPTVNVRFVDLGPVDRVLHAAASPTWIYVLLVFGLAAIAFELTQPGFGFAGFSGVAMVALGVYGLVVVPFSWLGLLLLVGGIGAMTGDVVVRRLGPLTWAGLAAFVAGSVLLFAGVAEQIDVSPWLIGFTALGALLYWGFGLTVAVQSRDRITSTQRGLVGLVGEARGELKPEGPVFVKGTMWRGRSTNGPIPSGARIRVRGVDGLTLRVQAEPPGDDAPEDPPLAD